MNQRKKVSGDEYYNSLRITSDRVIIHSDLNNFFASVETLFQPSLKDVPMAVCGNEKERHGIVLAKNEMAKKFGIKTGETVKSAREKCHMLVTCPSRYSEYIHYSRAVRDIYLRYTPNVEPFGIDEAWLDISRESGRKGPRYFENAEAISREIKETVFRETGLKVSVGISFNKTFSKLASDRKMGVISPDNYKSIVWRLPVRELLYVGKNTEELLRQNRLYTLSDVVRHKRSFLRELFGKNGEHVWDFANGFDFSPVSSYTADEDTDSVSNSRTLPYDIISVEDGENVLFSLCDSVVERIRKRKMSCTTVRIYIKTSDLSVVTRQKKRKKETDSLFEVFSDACELFRGNADFSKSIRSLGVSLEGLKSAESFQVSVFDSARDLKRCEIDRMMDRLKSKYGDKSLCRASSLTKTELSDFNKEHPSFNHNI
jgi:DNA polymerase-4